MKVIRVEDVERGIAVAFKNGQTYILAAGGFWIDPYGRRKGSEPEIKTRDELSRAYLQWLEKNPTTKSSPTDKQVYFDKKWQPAVFKSQQGMACTMEHRDHGILEVPFVHVRDHNPHCERCEDYLFRGSFQTNKGTSYCFACYQALDSQELELLFNGPQWMAWEGQMGMREMEQSHLVNSLNRLKRNAGSAAEAAGGKSEDYLHPSFEHLVEELHRRRPMEEKIKTNSYLLYIWSILFMIFGTGPKKEKA